MRDGKKKREKRHVRMRIFSCMSLFFLFVWRWHFLHACLVAFSRHRLARLHGGDENAQLLNAAYYDFELLEGLDGGINICLPSRAFFFAIAIVVFNYDSFSLVSLCINLIGQSVVGL